MADGEESTVEEGEREGRGERKGRREKGIYSRKARLGGAEQNSAASRTLSGRDLVPSVLKGELGTPA